MKLYPDMFKESAESKAPKGFWLNWLIYLLVMIIIMFAEGIVPSVMAMPKLMREMMNPENFNMNGSLEERIQQSVELSTQLLGDSTVMLVSLFCTVFGTILAIVYCRSFEKRSLSSMGFRKKNILSHYLRGVVTGFVLFSAVALMPVVLGISSISVSSSINIGMILAYLLGFFFQGMSEEVIMRGYFMNTLGGKSKPVIAVIASSVMFGLFHAGNPGFGLFPLFNLSLYGVFAALYIIAFDDIWGACAIHSVWNFLQGNFYGMSVSGAYRVDSVFITESHSSNDFISGGAFGAEGNIFTTIVLVVAIAAVLVKISKQQKSAA